MKLRQVLPPIDTSQIEDFRMPFDLEGYHARPICERAQHLFQEGLYVIEEKEDEEREL